MPHTPESLLRVLASALGDAGIPFMLTGSVASAFHGAGRATMDVDLVIDPTPAQLAAFVQHVEGAGIYVSDVAAREALEHRAMFNVVDPESGWKGDLIIRKERPFSLEEFRRRVPAVLLGIALDVATLEDLVISKLEWARMGGSSRQLEDVRSLLRLAEGDVDQSYIDHWVDVLELGRQWHEVAGG